MAQLTLQGKTVMIVDDSAVVREELRQAYEDIGLKVVAMAENGVKALDELERVTPDIVSLDIVMPEMNGIECYRIIKSHSPNQKVILVSVLAADPRITEIYKEEIPMHLFVPKPVKSATLESKLEQVLLGIEPKPELPRQEAPLLTAS